MASFWNSVKGAIELADDVAELKEDKTNLTTKLYEGDHKKQRCMCAKVFIYGKYLRDIVQSSFRYNSL